VSGVTVLVVEADGELNSRLLELIRSHGYDATGVRSPEQARRSLDDGLTPDVVLLDCTLGRADTEALLRRIRRDRRMSATQVIASSGSPAILSMVRPMADLELLKPFDTPALLLALQRVTR
jgi:CheY-like chemotaxis protein